MPIGHDADWARCRLGTMSIGHYAERSRSMLIRSSIPAQQLKSAALRYQRSSPVASAWDEPRRCLLAAPAIEPQPARPSGERSTADVDTARLEAVLFLAREPLSSRKL